MWKLLMGIFWIYSLLILWVSISSPELHHEQLRTIRKTSQKRLTIVLTLKRPKQKQKVLNPSSYEEALQGFVCLLRSWTAARQLQHVWIIVAFVWNCCMRCLMILRSSGYCCKHSTVGRWQKCASKFKIFAHLQEYRAFLSKTQFSVDSSE